MAILNPVVSKFTIGANNIQEVYYCPTTKSHAIVDLGILKDSMSGSSKVSIALTTESNPSNISDVSYFAREIELVNSSNSAEISKIIVGKGERLYVKVLEGSNVTTRLSGVEENNSKILKAGCLSSNSVPDTNINVIYSNPVSNASYILCSLNIFNTSNSTNAVIDAWFSSSSSPNTSDKVLNITLFPKKTAIINNIILTPNERIFVKSSLANTLYFVNGIIVGQ